MFSPRDLAGFVSHCIVLVRRLLADPRVPRRHKLLLLAALGYLLLPIDLVPDFVPVAGLLDDALVVALALRAVIRSAGETAVAELWPGPEGSLRVLLGLCDAGLTLRVCSWLGATRSAALLAAGFLGLAVTVWFDAADNCEFCGERDPLLLTSGRALAVGLCVVGMFALAGQAVARRRRARW